MFILSTAATAPLWAQAPASQPQQKPPADSQKNPPKPPAEANPFPDDTNNVPVLPNSDTPAIPAPSANEPPPAMPANDADPVRSPDDPAPGTYSSDSSSSSSSSFVGMDKIMPPPDEDTGNSKRGKKQLAPPEHQETAAEDENVGNYYLSSKNWRAALSRFESAVVLDPDNPEVYWGMAEAQRHLGDLANAKANYQKVVEYDPDSKHGKESKKILKDPDIANAPAAASVRPATPPGQ